MPHRFGAVASPPVARMLWPVSCAVLLALLIAGCATAPPRPPAGAPLPPLVPWTQRRAALQAVAYFSLEGRLAATNAQQGFSAGVHWRQRGSDATLQLTGPLGFGSAHVQQSGGALRVTTSKGVTLEGAAADDQLTAMLGFPPPLGSLRYWVLGTTDPADASAAQSIDTQQRLVHLQQDGWRIDYDEYTAVQRRWLPRRLTVARGALRLKMVINGWQLPPAASSAQAVGAAAAGAGHE